jgi:hypothetical protein
VSLNPGMSRRRLLSLGGAGPAAAAVGLSGLGGTADAATTPAIFYVPHQDDEALGYVGQIQQHKEAGRPVYLVLVTQGQNYGLLSGLQDQSQQCVLVNKWCSFPGHNHIGVTNDWTIDQIVSGRTSEFYQSAGKIGVDKIINWALPDIGAGGQTFNSLVSQVKSRVSALNKQYPGASHKFPAGWLDLQSTHKAISDAAYYLRDEVLDQRFTFMHIYGDYPDQCQRDQVTADYILPIPSGDMAVKQSAVMAYNTYHPAANLYTMGYHSYQVGLENAWLDPREWIYVLPSTYTTGDTGADNPPTLSC